LIGLLLVYTFLQNGFDLWLYREGNTAGNQRNFFYNTYYNFSIGVFYVAFTLALELSKRWYQQQLLLHRIQTEKLETELKYLKAQLNPHFLFNCINTIYFQIDKSNSEARESLQKFSELLRYQLYECNEDKIPIEKETSYLQSYVGLQRLRKDSMSNIVFSKDDSVKGFLIAPLLLLPLVENAFKHLSNFTDRDNIIELDMNRQNGYFSFSVRNSVNPKEDNNKSGIGLKNVKRRLDLLYENRYKLDILRSDNEFFVQLQIEIP
jgi:LytS/YehU family sensor histidine kinase